MIIQGFVFEMPSGMNEFYHGIFLLALLKQRQERPVSWGVPERVSNLILSRLVSALGPTQPHSVTVLLPP